MFERHGITVQRQVPVAARDGERPISLADFASAAKRVAIYVDGASFHRGVALRRDRRIRDALRAATPPWTVVELRAVDLGRETEIVAQLQALLKPDG
jgi:very-short-patch-repair endonuclease